MLPAAPQHALARSPDEAYWLALVQQVGREVASPLSAALDRISTLVSTGQIDHPNLLALQEEVTQARRVGMLGQQLVRYAAAEWAGSAECLLLNELLTSAIDERCSDFSLRGLTIVPQVEAVEVEADAALIDTLLHGLLDWAQNHALDTVALRVCGPGGPWRARIVCEFCWTAPHDRSAAHDHHGLDSLAWRLIQQTACALGVTAGRHIDQDRVVAHLDFPDSPSAAPVVKPKPIPNEWVPNTMAALTSRALNVPALAGCHLLVVTHDSALRDEVAQALMGHGLLIDTVANAAEAQAFCADGLPHAIAIDDRLPGGETDALRRALAQEAPLLTFIELLSDSEAMRLAVGSHAQVARHDLCTQLQQTLQRSLVNA